MTVLAVALVVGGAVVAGGLRLGRGAGKRGDVPTFTVARVKFARQVTAEGNLKAVKATPVNAPQTRMPMTVAWLAPEGSRVDEGDVVMKLDPTQMEKSLADALADRSAAELKIAKERIQSDTTMRERQRLADVTTQELDKIRAFPIKNPEFFPRSEIIDSEIDEGVFAAKLQHAADAKTTEKRLARSKLELLAIERRKAELLMKQAQDGLKDLQATAPHAGILVFTRDWRGKVAQVGDTVWPGNPIAEVARPEAMEAQVFVLEADAGGLAAGKKAALVIDSSPDVVHPARIRLVDALAKPRNREVPINYFGATLELENMDAGVHAAMKPGQRVTATLMLEDLADALVAPRQAVFDRDGKWIVHKRQGGRFEPAEVKLGTATAGRVVIQEGVQPGDVLALRDPTRGLRESLGSQAGKDEGGRASRGPSVGGAP